MIIPQEIIRRKRDGQELSRDEIAAFFMGSLRGEVSDYQVSAMLMAIFLRGMNAREASDLTAVMRDSGEKWTWPFDKRLLVDKHSTGGVGDKTSLILLPLLTLEGFKVPMMAGRGLGHTGGTVDKLESIPGMNQSLDQARAVKVMKECGGVFLCQSQSIAPLDKKLYALRDVTSTIESIPLITASILSKKMAEGTTTLVMDIKYGSGAFMQRVEQARELAQSIAVVGRAGGLNVSAMITSMDSPLGETAGNSLELFECVEVMQGRGPDDTRELVIALAEEMICQADPKRKREDVTNALRRRLSDGSVFESFCRQVRAQGGDTDVLTPKKLVIAPIQREILADQKMQGDGTGWGVNAIDVRLLGVAVQALGGGRRTAEDKIDHAVGLTRMKAAGDEVLPGEPLAIVHARDETSALAAEKLVREAYSLVPAGQQSVRPKLVEETIR